MSGENTGSGLEFSPRDRIRQAQERLLREHVAHLAAHSPYYRELFRERGIEPEEVCLDSLHRVPTTDKATLGERNHEFLAVPMSRVVDIVLSSGTTGRATTIMYTERDLQRLAYNEEISFAGCGVTANDIVLLTCTLDRCFIAGLAYFSGVRKIGAAAIRNGLSSVESHSEIIRRLKPTVLVGVPTFLLKLGRHLRANGTDPAATKVRRLICIGEPVRNREMEFLKIGTDLEELWGAWVFSTYASSETITSFCECEAQAGGHLHPDLAVVEILSDSGETLPPGQVGEVTVTPLAMEGMPLLRFRTGDIGFLLDEPCRCGRNSPRLGPIIGRKQQMIKFRGTTLYPNAINAVLDGMPGVGEYFVVASSDSDLSDLVGVYASVCDPACTAGLIAEKLQAHLRVLPEVTIMSDGEIRNRVYSGSTRKPIRFMDERKKR